MRSRARRKPDYRRRHRYGAVAGCAFAIAGLSALATPVARHLKAVGPMNVGHETLACTDCHRRAPGSLRQQLQANLRFAMGQRTVPASMGRLPIGNGACLSCHDRPEDRHPVFRFMEPRFADARRARSPHLCNGCHLEHQGVRVTATSDFCEACHLELDIPGDRLDVTHATLVDRGQWSSCLGCHDYHGSHQIEASTSFEAAITNGQIVEYLNGGASPYPGRRSSDVRASLAASTSGGQR